MPNASRPRALARLHSFTGAPALLLAWGSALAVGARLSGTEAQAHDWLPDAAVLAVWWVAVALVAAVHLGGSLARRRSTAPPSDGPPNGDEGRVLRLGAGMLTVLGGCAVLAVVAPAAFGHASAAEVYGCLDALLSVLPGLGAACVVSAAGGLYVAEELPRASQALGLTRPGPRGRALHVIAIALGVILFARTMHVVSHFSVGGPLLGADTAAPSPHTAAAPGAAL